MAEATGEATPLRGLDRVPEPAWLLRLGTTAAFPAANVLGRERQEREPEVLAPVIEALGRGATPPPHFDVTLLAEDKGVRFYLVIEEEGVADRILRLRRRFELTDRQADVALLLLEGRSNKEIAKQLRASVRTVEVHVSALLRRSSAASRGEFIAMFWRRSG